MKYTIYLLTFKVCQALTKGLTSHSHKGSYNRKKGILTDGREGMKKWNRK